MKQFTAEELREALFGLPQLACYSKETVSKLFLEEKLTKIPKRLLAELRDTGVPGPWVHLRDTYLWDAMAKLLCMPREAVTLWARQHEKEIQNLFDEGDRISWTNEEWVLALVNLAAKHLFKTS
ncbi:MAG: hypothetical protein A3C93_06445 [Candidatus Lloydbacteria bacterium RIFCSPHIGHO2_02_FULL_54_17]|uniref:Uncharacterized protein n=1 Tax=Candidatus Lloydbacteria bacterium RIFCSPHIGHO2_02_FULL_54_17 TaxID=1798664 RepID=A0A1G2DGF0_9BACT|nr:MAG: hypothetical protein A2762_01430 [Candidatus Lloydbacteria bacterium RIFCSPHIGHO2_01_FULL_54_11]OGZ12715.1 MAG: hypothetical protein A3C93_06445 [Candidatus Lloydbacteria bacterium RIFCSPHIGHO2_02_FULL_54_17]OGZ13566.1 MAG: hypothetical protein A2948_05105 [Candidatus Lloydbacteria bacterium RIFCSPLOWO2_01_FULL_54_18]OGZ16234.1 MAG: hypothetical protein A3H76_03935 [Candidatus Lloydbacteria bacterium RIFCSPLOWO2_02_FULL_54_12]